MGSPQSLTGSWYPAQGQGAAGVAGNCPQCGGLWGQEQPRWGSPSTFLLLTLVTPASRGSSECDPWRGAVGVQGRVEAESLPVCR